MKTPDHPESSYTSTSSPRLRDMAVQERPQERLERQGAAALSDTELLAMLLRSGSKDFDVLSLSSSLIAEAGSLAGLLRWTVDDFRKHHGIGHVKALQLITVMEVARRVVLAEAGEAPLIKDATDAYAYMRPFAAGLEIEKFWTLCLDSKRRLIRRVEVSSGIANASLVHPREVFREAIRAGAISIVCAHNHPSGDPAPSAADIKTTRQLRESAKVLNIRLDDHIILGLPHNDSQGLGYYSCRDAGLI